MKDPVVIWEDYSGNGGDMIADDDANDDDTLDTDRLPVLRTGVLNGHPVLEFDGIDDYMRNFTAYNDPNTVFLVARYTTKNATTSGRVLAGASSSWFVGYYNNRQDQYYANGWVHSPSVTATEDWRTYTLRITPVTTCSDFSKIMSPCNQLPVVPLDQGVWD